MSFLKGVEPPIVAAIVSAGTTLVVLGINLLTKKKAETSLLSSKLKTEHNFEQRKRIMEVLSKYKVQLLNACEDLGHRLNNFDGNKNYGDMRVKGQYVKEEYYFHSFVYRVVCVFGWIKRIEREMIFLDTTLASSGDLDFLKFLRLFPRVFCNMSVVGAKDGAFPEDARFTRHKFEVLADCILTAEGVKSYSLFVEQLPQVQVELGFLFEFLDGVRPKEERVRWHRLKLLHALLIVFLNCYGYDFQKTDDEKARKMLCRPFPSSYTQNYSRFFKKYHLDQCPEVQRFLQLISSFHPSSIPPPIPQVIGVVPGVISLVPALNLKVMNAS